MKVQFLLSNIETEPNCQWSEEHPCAYLGGTIPIHEIGVPTTPIRSPKFPSVIGHDEYDVKQPGDLFNLGKSPCSLIF